MKKLLSGLVLAMIPLVMFGCGSGDFLSGSGGTTISGMAAKGPITGGTVSIFAVTTSAHILPTPLTTVQPTSGSFSANLGSYKGAIFATMSGGTYTSEATGTKGVPLSQKLHAATYITNSGPVNLAITPLSEVAFRRMSSLTQTRITNANARVASLYLKGLSSGKDVVNTLPADVTSSAATTATNPDSINYGLALATVSQLLTGTSATLESVVTSLGNALATSDTTAYISAFNALPTTYLQSGIKATPLSVVLAFTSATKTGGVAGTGDKVGLTATVTGFGGTAVADGTTVTFAVTSGSGTLTATSVQTSGGSASVSVSSNAVNTVVVTATAGTVTSGSLSVLFGQNPNDPASVTLKASPATATANGTSQITLSATVPAVQGGSVPDGTSIAFAITSGSGNLSAASATTTGGIASVTLTSTTIGSVTVTATAKTALGAAVSGSSTVSFTPDPGAPATVAVSASPSSIAATGATTSTITATVTNYAGTALSDVPVTFSTTGGALSATSATTNSSGIATVTLTSATTTGSGTVTASATADSVTKTGSTTVTFTAVASGTATVIVATSGTLSSGTTIGSIQATLTYLTGIGLTPTAAVASGAGAGSILTPNLTGTAGDVTLGLITTTGISTGQFATITFSYSGTKPVASDFAIASGTLITDTLGNSLSGISVVVQSVTVN